MDTFPPAKQKPRLLMLEAALESAKSAMRRDECGDWAIFGNEKKGQRSRIYAVPEGFQLVCFTGERPQKWTWLKKRLEQFCTLTQDGDDEGCFILARLPSEEEAEAIRDELHIPRAPRLSEDQREQMASRARRLKSTTD